jgi:hypothetical protein
MEDEKNGEDLLTRIHRIQAEFLRRDPEYKQAYQKLKAIEESEREAGVDANYASAEWRDQHKKIRTQYGLADNFTTLYPPYPDPMGQILTIGEGIRDLRIRSKLLGEGTQERRVRDDLLEEYEIAVTIDLRRHQDQLFDSLARKIDMERKKLEDYISVGRRMVDKWEDYLKAWDLSHSDLTIEEIGKELGVVRSTAQGWIDNADKIIIEKRYKSFLKVVDCTK